MQSLNTGSHFITNAIHEHQCDIIGITETWLNPADIGFNIKNYSVVRCDRPTRGGGIAVYIKQGITFELYHKTSVFPTNIEQVWLIIKSKKKKIGFCVFYRVPGSAMDSFNDVTEVMENVFLEVDSVIMMGDININFLNNTNKNVTHFHNVFSTFNLRQIVDAPTRITPISESLIDIVCISDNLKCNHCDVLDTCGASDHMCVVFSVQELEAQKTITPNFFSRDLKNIDPDQFQHDARNLQWELPADGSLNENLNLLNNNIIFLFDLHAPTKLIFPKKKLKPPYITYNIEKMIALKNKAHKKYNKHRTPENKVYFTELRNYVNEAIKREKNAYMNYQLNQSKNNPKMLWKSLSEWGINSRKNSNQNLNLEERICAQDINEYFVNVTEDSAANENYVNYFKCRKMNDKKISLSEITIESLNKILNSIKSEATGSDGINIRMLRLVSPYCINLILRIINLSLRTGVFPDCWKVASVVPIPKVTNAKSFNELRPISILPTMSKLLEKVVEQQLRASIDNLNIIPMMQSGFRPNFSAMSALIKVTNDLTIAVDQSKLAILVLLDQTKAFDLVDIPLLLAKLKYIGLDELACAWFHSYLTGRSQQVKYKNTISQTLKLNKGVPQGSILGPLLFIIYAFDLPDSIKHCNYHMYADDLQIYHTFNTSNIKLAIQLINNDLQNIYDWCNNNGLKINASKSQVLCVGNNKLKERLDITNFPIIINNDKIKFSKTAKNLGIIFNTCLTFEEQKNYIRRICFAKLKMLYPLKFNLGPEIKLKLIKSLIYPHIDYCSPVYYFHLNKTNQHKIQLVQNACMRFIFNFPVREHVSPYFVKSQELNIYQRVNYLYLSFLHQIVHSGNPSYLAEHLKSRSETHSVNIRVDTYTIPKHNSKKFEASFSYQAAHLLNKFINIIDHSHYQFKTLVKERLISVQLC